MTDAAQPQDNQAIYKYMISYGSALQALGAEKDYFDGIASNIMSSESDQSNAIAASQGLSDDIALLKAAHQAFMDKFQNALSPPGPDVIARSQQLATALASQLRSTQQASAILDCVTQFLADWNALSAGAAPAAAAAAAPVASPAALARAGAAHQVAWLAGHTGSRK